MRHGHAYGKHIGAWDLDSIARIHFDLLTRDLTLHLLRRRSTAGGAGPLPTKGGLAPWQARGVLDYLHTISQAELAAEARLSTFHFARALRQTLGAPPHRYLAGLRLDRARHSLETTDLAVTEVAAQLWYQTPQALAHVFRRDLGLRRRDWRRLRQQG
jgi:AraC family transcriptional regulator